MGIAVRRLRILAFLVFFVPAPGRAADVQVIGLFPGKAVVIVDDGPMRTLSVGQRTAEGVTLISTDRVSATFDIDGQRRTIPLGPQHSAPVAASSRESATLTADTRGHFTVDGQINGGPVRFLLDTGATAVVLSSNEAERLGVDYLRGAPSLVSTANGAAPAYRVKLDTVRVGDIVVNNVDGLVMVGNVLPIALLGMSFLNRMEMKRDGATMVLTKRF